MIRPFILAGLLLPLFGIRIFAQGETGVAEAGVPVESGTLTIGNAEDGGILISIGEASVAVSAEMASNMAAWIKKGDLGNFSSTGPLILSRSKDWLVIVVAPVGKPPTTLQIKKQAALQFGSALESAIQNVQQQ